MADLLILEFSAPEAVGLYNQVNKLIGIDPSTDSGDWPAGLLTHQAAGQGDGLVVVESWESRAAQEQFISTRLGPALRRGEHPVSGPHDLAAPGRWLGARLTERAASAAARGEP
jgi:hypothetical protein